MSHEPPQNLISCFHKKEEWAMKQIWNSNLVMVSTLVEKFLGDNPYSKDMVNDIFIAMYNNKEYLPSQDDITRWLNMVTFRKCQDFQKKQETIQRHEGRLTYHFKSMEQDDIESAESFAYLRHLIRHEIARIPGKAGRIFHMSFMQGLSDEEIALQLVISEKSVGNHKSNAMKYLKMNRENIQRRFALPAIIIILIYLYETI